MSDKEDGIIYIEALENVLSGQGKTFKFVLSGGEPFYARNLVEACRMITKKHFVGIISNMTHDNVRSFAGTIDPSRVPFISAAAHIRQLAMRGLFDQFVSNCVLYKEKKFRIMVFTVAYPDLVGTIDSHRQIFAKYGLELTFKPFYGTWKKKTYPGSLYGGRNPVIRTGLLSLYQNEYLLAKAAAVQRGI